MKNQGRVQDQASVKQKVGRWLQTAPRGSQKQTARALGVSTRTLRSWQRTFDVPVRRPGRKRQQVGFGVLRTIVIEWQSQGQPGSRPVSCALPHVPLRIIRDVVARLKKKKRKRFRLVQELHRTSVVVHRAGVVLVADGATIKTNAATSSDFLVIRDRASLKTSVRRCSLPHLRAIDTLAALEKLKSQNKLPLVFGTDNGSPLCAREVSEFAARHKIIHLRSLPRVPQHNGSAENAVRELKQVVGLGLAPNDACDLLNYSRHRKKLGGKTSHKFERENCKEIKDDERARFYASACLAIEAAKLGKKSACQKRKAEREAIFQTLERFSLITRTKGHLALPTKPEVIS